METTAGLARYWSGFTEKDVRKLVGFLDDLRQHDWQAMIGGADDWGLFCRQILQHDPDFIAEMEDGVRALAAAGHNGPVSPEQASAAARSQAAATATTGAVLPVGRPTDESNGANCTIDAPSRAATAGVSLRTQRKLDALARRAPAHLARVQAGDISVHRACIEAGILKEPTGLQLLRTAWKKATVGERVAFLAEVGKES